MCSANPHHTATIFQSKPLGYVDGIVIPVPHLNAFLSQSFSHNTRMQVIQAEGIGCHALI
jgi:hypothetical protein